MPKQAKSSSELDEESAGRFYSTLLSLSDPDDSKRTYRRQALGLLQGISAKLRARSKKSTGHTGFHPSTHLIAALTYRVNAEHVVKVRELQRGLGFTAGGVTRRLDAMIADGLIDREPDPEDGRALLARLTPKGIRLAEFLLEDADKQSRRLEDAFSQREWQTLLKLLSRLEQQID